MFNVHIHNGVELPKDDIYYIVAKEGIFLKKKTGIMESIAPVKGISILESIESTANMNIKKIPGGQFARVVTFFREVYKKYYGEAIVLIFYDETRHIYKFVAPHQKVTSGTCDYDKGISVENMQMIGTIHSHANMSAFHSGVDDKDEEHFDGLHITVGNMRDENVSITASIVANGHRFVIDPLDYIDRLELTVNVDKVEKRPAQRTFRWINGRMIESKPTTYTNYRRFDKRYTVNVSSKYHKVPNGWMEMVEKGTYIRHGNLFGYVGDWGLYDNRNQSYNFGNNAWGGWGSGFNSSLWNQANLPATTNQGGKTTTPQTQKVTPIEFPPHDIDIEDETENSIPCETCAYRSHKFLSEQEETFFEPEIYVCKKCDETIVDDTESEYMPLCPNCNSDEYLVLLSEDELPSHYISIDESSKPEVKPGIKSDSVYVTCKSCSSSFRKFDTDVTCPFCYAMLDNDEYDSEQSLIDQSNSDSGVSLVNEQANETAIFEAMKYSEEPIERIPDPNEVTIPIAEKVDDDKSYKNTIQKMFRNVFGGKK